MKNIIIAAGYATRLYPLTENWPKPLLEIGESTILGRILHDVDEFDEIDEHIVVTNHKFAHIFEEWAKNQSFSKPVRIIDDGTTDNENRLGAVRDLLLAIDLCEIQDDIMVLAADNLLDFSFRGFLDDFLKHRRSLIMYYHEPELKKLQRTGVIDLDKDNRVVLMQEKPQEPVSNRAVPPFYIYSKEDLPLILTALENGCGFDAPGNLASYLARNTELRAYEMPGTRFDIGSLDTYEEAKRIYG